MRVVSCGNKHLTFAHPTSFARIPQTFPKNNSTAPTDSQLHLQEWSSRALRASECLMYALHDTIHIFSHPTYLQHPIRERIGRQNVSCILLHDTIHIFSHTLSLSLPLPLPLSLSLLHDTIHIFSHPTYLQHPIRARIGCENV